MTFLTRRDFLKTGSGISAGFVVWACGSPRSFAQSPGGSQHPLELRFRQVHLDFHTSRFIEGIASRFDPDEFAATLQKAHVNSVTCFGRCHHGFIYYDTKKFPERRHPHLQRNLLKDQIDACHKRDIRVPVYITIQWDHFTSQSHPEWLVLDDQGKPIGTPIYEAGFYRFLCVNSPYTDFIKAHLKELFEVVPVDGLFLDIVQVKDCSCRYCREDMVSAGMEPSRLEDRLKFAFDLNNRFKDEITRFIRTMDKKCSIFYNAGHLGPHIRSSVQSYTHFELESLPSGHWGYLHFPLTVRFVRNLGLDYMGMTGKFHTSWGDFHSFKNKAALQFEVFSMLAFGAKCSIGDQLHPNGKIDPVTYDLIGSVYSEVEKKEPWCRRSKPVTEIGVFTAEEFIEDRLPAPSLGVVRMLQEGAHQFDMIDTRSDLAAYRVLILPDVITVDETLAGRLNAFLAGGGSLIASHRSGLDSSGTAFSLKALGVDLVGDAPYSPDFILPGDPVGKNLAKTEYVMYMQGLETRPSNGTEVLAQTIVPYFNRTYKHFSSHRHTPSSGKVGYPAIVRNGRTVYFMHPIFTQYARNAPRWCKQLFLNALELLLPEPLIRLQGPTTIISTVNAQSENNRWVVHLLNYIPERRGTEFDIIEDILPLYELKLSVRAPSVKHVLLVPQKKPLEFKNETGRIELVVPKLEGHQMIELSFV